MINVLFFWIEQTSLAKSYYGLFQQLQSLF